MKFTTYLNRLAVFVFVLVAGSFLLKANAYAATLQLSPASGSFAAGKSFEVKINVSISNEKVDGLDAKLSFDSDLLEVKEIKTGTLFATYPVKNYDNTAGKVSVSALAELGGDPITTSGTVATIVFNALKSGSASVTILNTSHIAENQTGTDIIKADSFVNGSYTITGSGSSSTGSPVGGGTTTTTTTTTSSSSELLTAGGESLTLFVLLIGGLFMAAGIGMRLKTR